MDSTHTLTLGITQSSKTSGSKVCFKELTTGHLGFMQITRVAHSCRLGSQAEFVLGPDESKSTMG